jgi:single-strand DNA-binding protein
MIHTREIRIIGNVGQQPKYGQTSNGNNYLSFSVANYEGYTDRQSGERIDKSEWTSCIVWGEQATRLSEKIHKGMKLMVVGKPYGDGYIGKDGQPVYQVKVTVTDIMFLSKADEVDNAATSRTESHSSVKNAIPQPSNTPTHAPDMTLAQEMESESDDLPF